jgi:CheY-like chemotaxis protein
VAASDGEDALAALQKPPGGRAFDAFVCDIAMPGADGYDVIRRVRALPPERGGATPAIALTAYARPEDRVRALQAGFQMHVAKPVDPGELLVIMTALLGRTGARAKA